MSFTLQDVTLSVLRDIRATGLIMLIYTCSMRIRETRVLGARTHGIKAVLVQHYMVVRSGMDF